MKRLDLAAIARARRAVAEALGGEKAPNPAGDRDWLEALREAAKLAAAVLQYTMGRNAAGEAEIEQAKSKLDESCKRAERSVRETERYMNAEIQASEALASRNVKLDAAGVDRTVESVGSTIALHQDLVGSVAWLKSAVLGKIRLQSIRGEDVPEGVAVSVRTLSEYLKLDGNKEGMGIATAFACLQYNLEKTEAKEAGRDFDGPADCPGCVLSMAAIPLVARIGQRHSMCSQLIHVAVARIVASGVADQESATKRIFDYAEQAIKGIRAKDASRAD
jgi:hypothetical protein